MPLARIFGLSVGGAGHALVVVLHRRVLVGRQRRVLTVLLIWTQKQRH